MNGGGKICRRCLLDDMEEDEYIRSLKEYISAYPSDKRVADSVYSERLKICGSCKNLSGGMCAKCGCFAELRALKPEQRCPDTPRKW